MFYQVNQMNLDVNNYALELLLSALEEVGLKDSWLGIIFNKIYQQVVSYQVV